MPVVTSIKRGGVQMADKVGSQGAVVGAAPGLRASGDTQEPALEYVRQALAGLQYGLVAIIVQDGVIIQVERTERKRFRKGEQKSA
jgi:hypothetical protein